jgi:hypothetical protein
MWCITTITPEYRERMYKVLDLYKEKYDRQFPVICFDEKSKQLLEDSRAPMPLKPGSPLRYDYEYKRHGTCNIFAAVEPKAGRHFIKVTDHRAKSDFANFIKEMVEKQYKEAIKVRIVLDNLNTHFEKSFYETFSKKEATRLLKRVQFVYTPKHASWLNMAEIEINMMDRECLDRNIKSRKLLERELQAWVNQNNIEKRKIKWSFTRTKADKKLSKYYVS